MWLYTFKCSTQWKDEIKQIASRLSMEEVKRTYFDSFWECVTRFKLDEEFSKKISENNYLWEFEIPNPSYEG